MRVATDYDEDRELTRYIWKNYQSAMTQAERMEHVWIARELKARHNGDSGMARRLRQPIPLLSRRRVARAATEGIAEHEARVAKRVLRDHEEEIFINRCPECSRIVVSPIACTCLWCSYSWYERRDELLQKADSKFYPPE